MSQFKYGEMTDSVNLQELVEKYVWKLFKKDTGFKETFFIGKKTYTFDIRWACLDFSHKFESTPRPETQGTENQDVQLYTSTYENRTNTDQSYTFSTSRETTASTKIELQEYYTIGAETNLKISLGEIVSFGGGVIGSMSITDTKGAELSKTVKWDVNAEIKVPRRNKVTASLSVSEKRSTIDFTVETTVSLAAPARTLPVTIWKDDEKVKTYWIENIECLFGKKLTESESPKVKVKTIGSGDMAEIVAILTTKGVCRHDCFQNQQVTVECEPIDGA